MENESYDYTQDPEEETNLFVRFVAELRSRAVAVEQQLVKQGFVFEVVEDLGVREWWLFEGQVHGGTPQTVIAKAKEIDKELMDMADIFDPNDTERFETKLGDR